MEDLMKWRPSVVKDDGKSKSGPYFTVGVVDWSCQSCGHVAVQVARRTLLDIGVLLEGWCLECAPRDVIVLVTLQDS